MTQFPGGAEPMGDEDFDDIEWELSCSAREAAVGLIPSPMKNLPAVPAGFGRSRPWERR